MTDRVHLDSPRFRRLAKAYSNEYRRLILLLLHRAPRLSLTEISDQLDIPVSSAQYNVDKLLSLGLIKVDDASPGGSTTYYTVTAGSPVLDPAPSEDAGSSTGNDSGGGASVPPPTGSTDPPR